LRWKGEPLSACYQLWAANSPEKYVVNIPATDYN
jgi:hypothetical protein